MFNEFILRDGAHPAGIGGTQTVYKFPNGYGASVVSGSFFYTDGDEKEIAVLKFDDGDSDSFELDYSTPITSDVLGHVPSDEVDEVLKQIKALPAKENDDA